MPSPDAYRMNAADGDFVDLATIARRARLVLPGEIVSAYCGSPTAEVNVTGPFTYHTYHQMTQDVTEVRVVWSQGYWLDSVPVTEGEKLTQNAYPMRASILLNGVIIRLTVDGNDGWTISPGGGITVSDPVAVDLSAKQGFIVRTFYNMTNGQKVPGCCGELRNGVSYTAAQIGYTSGDVTGTTANPTTADTAKYGGPNVIIGNTVSKPYNSLFVVGASVEFGYNDDTVKYNSSYISRASDANTPIFNYSTLGAMLNTTRGSHPYGFPMLSNFSHLYNGLHSNDIFNGRSAAQVIADLTWLFTAARNRGVKTLCATIIPRTNAANNAIVSGFGVGEARDVVNAWIRGGGAGLIDQVVDVARTVESVASPGFWASNAYTTDGVHPQPAAHALMAAACNWNNLP